MSRAVGTPACRPFAFGEAIIVVDKTCHSPTPMLEQHMMWDDIAILARYLLMLSFNNCLDVARHLPYLFHTVTFLVCSGTVSMRAATHGLVINIIHSLCTCTTPSFSEETQRVLMLSLDEFALPKFYQMFGISKVKSAAVTAFRSPYNRHTGDWYSEHSYATANTESGASSNSAGTVLPPPPPPQGPTDRERLPLQSLETITDALLEIMEACMRDIPECDWLQTWTSLAKSFAFCFNPALQPRALIVFGCIILQESAPSYTMVKNGSLISTRTRAVKMILTGRPVTVVTEENVLKIEKLVLADRRIKLWQIAEELQISKERVGEIIHEHMNMRKISARWIPKMLTPFDKQRRLQTSDDFLELVGDNIDEICDRIVTVVKPEFDNTIRNLNRSPCNGRKKEKGRRRNSGFKSRHRSLWRQFFGIVKTREAVVQKRRGKLSRGVLFLQDNASVHTTRVSRQDLKDTGFSEIYHPPYSPDLAPSDYFLFQFKKGVTWS
ncbi:Neurofibromin [Eumeta japonica]|uniref:Neurofibromin n=1 Tax=Eumeta variegata TaxID=151549 RepID=A0A4C1ZLD4_EUMVA|nr:Neurofibromin [Eumeta japonica]